MSFVQHRAVADVWTRQGIKCDGCPIAWYQDFPDQPMEASGFYEVRLGLWSVMHACSEGCCNKAELISSYAGWQQDKDNIRFPSFRWKKIAPAPLVYQGEGI